MALSDADIAELTRLEESMWRAETRFDRAWLERVWAEDFFEFGRSGRVYSHEDMMDVGEPVEIAAKLPLRDLKFTEVGTDTVLVTYISEVLHDTWEVANRSSIWTRTADGWRMRFHQGTPRT